MKKKNKIYKEEFKQQTVKLYAKCLLFKHYSTVPVLCLVNYFAAVDMKNQHIA
ncbi:MAG: hypothetical protein FWF76_07635 [Oscillospiraceae bacterium]|nr:hypothetical protein [Oscillospiraceae bacterium]